MNPLFTHKHYEHFAKYIGVRLQIAVRTKDTEREIFLHFHLGELMEMFSSDNPGFKPELFQKRVGQFMSGERS